MWRQRTASTRARSTCTASTRGRCAFETFGGFSPEVVELLAALAEERQNRLSTAEYDQTTWSARTWTSFTVQKLSVALHRAVAMEIGLALGLSVATDPRA